MSAKGTSTHLTCDFTDSLKGTFIKFSNIRIVNKIVCLYLLAKHNKIIM